MMQKKLISLQLARGLAAILVFVMHLFNMAAATTASEWSMHCAHFLHYFGHIGVDIFFVLSGVVMCMVISRLESSEHFYKDALRNAADFLVRRIMRVYPLFWITLLACLILPAVPGADNSFATLLHNPASLLLLTKPAAHPVAWTLVYEVQFYSVATIILLLGRYAKKALIVWASLQIIFVASSKAHFLPQWPIFDALSLEFSMGIFIGMFGALHNLRAPILWGVLAIAAALGASLYYGEEIIGHNTLLRVIVWGMPAALLVASMLSYENKRVLEKSMFSKLGDISYSLYMWHPIGLLIPLVLLKPWNTGGRVTVTMVYLTLSIALTFSISFLSYRYFEKPLSQLFYRRKRAAE